jgi:hypothetical protein
MGTLRFAHPTFLHAPAKPFTNRDCARFGVETGAMLG